jgi:general secretion pathway protein D
MVGQNPQDNLRSIATERVRLRRTPKRRGGAIGMAALAVLAFAGAFAQERSNTQQAASATVAENASGAAQVSAPSANAREPTRITGTGQLYAPPMPAEASAAASTGEGYQLNFTDTDISAVVSSVIVDGLGLPVLVDPQVKGTMTLQAARPLAREELLAALETALRLQNAALVDVNGVYHVVPLKDAPRRITALRAPGQGTVGFGIYVVPLKFVSPADMERLLQPFAPDGGILKVDTSRNLLLLAGGAQEIATLLNVINTFDVDWLSGVSFAMYPLENVDASTLAGELGEIFSDPKSPIAGVVRFVPIGRLNTLLVASAQPQYFAQVEGWIHRLDVAAATPGRRIYVYDVQNGKADDLARSLSNILSLEYTDTTADAGASTSLGAPGAGAQSAPSGPTRSSSSRSSNGGLEGSGLRIVPNGENNALLVLASPTEYNIVEAALKRLDVVPIQVLIEASIAEVTLTNDLRFGLQWSYQSSSGPLILSEATSGTINQQFPGFSYLYTGRTDIRAVLNTLESLTNVRVLSSPKLMVLNNRQAQLQIGDQVPIAVQSAVSTVGSSSPLVNTVQLHDTGVILRVTPRANKSGRVLLEVSQEVSDVVPNKTSGIDSPTIQQRKLQSVVTVESGDTIALGGLIRDSRTRTRGGLPYLRRIPVLGTLFGSTNKNSTRTELIVLITPKIIRSPVESDAAMADLQKQFNALRKVVPGWKSRSPKNAPKDDAH